MGKFQNICRSMLKICSYVCVHTYWWLQPKIQFLILITTIYSSILIFRSNILTSIWYGRRHLPKAKHTELSILTSENWEKIEMLVQNVIQAASASSAVSSGNWISEHRKEYISLKSKRNASIFKHIYEVIVLTFSPISIHTHQNTTSNRMRWWITKRWTFLSECNNSKNKMAFPKLFVRSICITENKIVKSKITSTPNW